MKQLYTRWGKNLDPKNILPEHPNPLCRREHFTILNGTWHYAITDSASRPTAGMGKSLYPSPRKASFQASTDSFSRGSISGTGDLFRRSAPMMLKCRNELPARRRDVISSTSARWISGVKSTSTDMLWAATRVAIFPLP